MLSRLRLTPLLLAAVCLVGCQMGTLPDPNDPKDVGLRQADVLLSCLRGASDALNARRIGGEIDDDGYRKYMADYAASLLKGIEIPNVPKDRYWEYAEVQRTAERWPDAAKWYAQAVKYAKAEDRRVNDSLRLAQCLAMIGKVTQAIKVARSVFNTSPNEKAPIITAVVLEIAPAARGKGEDVAVAQLLVDSIAQAEQTVVDPNTDAGSAYIAARPFHVRHAWSFAIELFQHAGRTDLAKKAVAASGQSTSDHAQL